MTSDLNSNAPLYIQAKQRLEQMIKSGELRPSDKISPETELSQKLGISRTTVRQALRLLEEMGIVVRDRGRGTFISENARDILSCRIKGSIGFVLPFLDASYAADIMAGATREAAKQGYNLILRDSENDPGKEAQAIKSLVEHGVEGILLFPCTERFYSRTVLKLHLDDYPIVMVGRKYSHLPIPAVEADNYNGAREAAEYLHELGCREFALISPAVSHMSSVEARLNGYRDVCLERGIPAKTVWIETGHPEESSIYWERRDVNALENSIATIQNFLERNPKVDAILTCNDLLAVDALKANARLGRRVPDDISVIGFDDAPFSSQLDPMLTTVRVPRLEMGQAAITVITKLLQGEMPESLSICIPTSLVVRGSTIHSSQEKPILAVSVNAI
ncbi:MAG: GntR family transcriptional regulator [Firmicutes bacterium]|nr:GntR family transcriptional regulator [Bacillota bacterium]